MGVLSRALSDAVDYNIVLVCRLESVACESLAMIPHHTPNRSRVGNRDAVGT